MASKIPERVKCPFTGEYLKIVRHPTRGAWRAVGKFYFTKWYGDGVYPKQAMLFDLSQRDGKPPDFSRQPVIEIREIEPPAPDPLADVKERDKAVGDFVAEELSE